MALELAFGAKSSFNYLYFASIRFLNVHVLHLPLFLFVIAKMVAVRTWEMMTLV